MVFLCRVFDVRVNEKQVGFAVDVLDSNLEAVEAGDVTSVAKLLLRFSLRMLSDEAKKSSTWEMKWRSLLVR